MSRQNRLQGQTTPGAISTEALQRGANIIWFAGLLCVLNWIFPWLVPFISRQMLESFAAGGSSARLMMALVDVLSQVLMIFGLVIAGMRISGLSWGDMGLARVSVADKQLLAGLTIGSVYGITIQMLIKTSGYHPVGWLPGLVGLIYAARNTIISPFLEELFFRGLIFKLLEKKLNAPANIFVNSLAYALTHCYLGTLLNASGLSGRAAIGSFFWIVPVYFVLGCVCSLLRSRSGSLWPAITAHMGYNLMQLIL